MIFFKVMDVKLPKGEIFFEDRISPRNKENNFGQKVRLMSQDDEGVVDDLLQHNVKLTLGFV